MINPEPDLVKTVFFLAKINLINQATKTDIKWFHFGQHGIGQ